MIKFCIYDYRMRPLLELMYKDNQTAAIFIVNDIKNDVDKWLTHGITEIINDDIRVTTSDDSEFLPRLHDYIRRQYNFCCSIEYGTGERND